MLPRKYRLTFQKFQKNPHKVIYRNQKLLKIIIKESPELNTRLVITVPKSLDKRSVYRHRTKRIIIEGVRFMLTRLKNKQDILIRANKILTKKNYDEVLYELSRAILL